MAKRRHADRLAELRAILESRRRALTDGMNGLMRDARSRSADDRDVPDTPEGADIDTQTDLDFALIQMKAETLSRIDAALRRLDANAYGDCAECGKAISSERLRALPFAVRCTACEDARERRARSAVSRHRGASSTVGFDAVE